MRPKWKNNNFLIVDLILFQNNCTALKYSTTTCSVPLLRIDEILVAYVLYNITNYILGVQTGYQ